MRLPLTSFTCTLLAWTTTRGKRYFAKFQAVFADLLRSNFTQFYSTKSERDRNLKKEYETQMEYRRHLQAFIDRWRYNANRGMSSRGG